MGKVLRWGNSSSFLLFVTLISVGVFVCRLDVRVVDFVVVFCDVLEVLFDCLFFGSVPVVSFSWFFFSAAAVFDFGEDDFAFFDTPGEFVTFFPLERVEDVVWDFNEVVFRVGILLNSCGELTSHNYSPLTT